MTSIVSAPACRVLTPAGGCAVCGRHVSHKIAPILRRVYDQMCEPKWVWPSGLYLHGGFYNNYATVQGIDTIIPVDIYIPGCPRVRKLSSTG